MRHGATQEQIDSLLEFESGPFSDKEKAALAYAKQLTIDPHGVDDAMFDRLRKVFDEGEVIEISAMAGLFNYFNRINDALQMTPTAPGEGL